MPNLECVCCKASIEKLLAVTCTICNKTYKYSCVGLSQAELRSINNKTKNISWNCVNCNAIGNDINSLKEAILSLQNELRTLRSNNLVNGGTKYEFEDFMQEFEDRQARKRNVIVFGIAEQSSDLDKNTRLAEERSAVIGLLNDTSPDVALADNSKIFRLGKFNATSTKPRPLRLCLQNESMVHNLIHKFASAKKNNNNFKHISISFDRTPKQLEHFKALKAELEERRNSGEANLKIQFVRGRPRITTLNDARPTAQRT